MGGWGQEDAAEATRPTSAHGVGPAPLLGRDRELEQLLGATRGHRHARDRLVLVLGEAGMGKTRLLRELATRAGSDVEVAWGRCSDRDDAPALWPWVQVLRTLARRRTRAQLTASARSAAIVARVVPDLAELLDTPTLETEPTPFEVVDALATTLLHTVSEPALVLLDDLHAADRASLDLLDVLAAEAGHEPLTIMAAARPGTDPEALSSLAARADVISLRGLGEDAVRRLAVASGGDPDTDVADLVRRTGGNPFYVQAVAASADATRVGGIPVGVRGLLQTRVASLPAEVVAALTATAVLGDDADAELLGAICDRTPSEALEDLKTLADLDLVEQTPDRPTHWRLGHDLLRHAVLDRCSDAERRRLHGACARALVERLGDDPDAAARLAHHHVAALPLVERAAAVHWLRRAADHAAARLAHLDADRHLQTAASLLRLDRRDRHDLLEVLLAQGAARARATGPPSAHPTWREAAALARRLDRPEAFARAVLGICAGQRRAPGFFMEAVGEVEEIGEALALLAGATTTDADVLRAQLLATRALHLALDGRVDVLGAAVTDASRAAAAVDDPRARALAAASRRACLPAGTDLTTSEAATAELHTWAEAAGDRELRWLAHRHGFADALAAGDPRAAAAAADACVRLATELQAPHLEALSLVWMGTLAQAQGRFADFAEISARAEAAVARAGGAGAETLGGQQVYHAGELGTGDTQVVDTFAVEHPTAQVLRAVRAWYHLRCGDRGRARELFRALTTAGLDAVPRHDYWLAMMAMCAELAARLGDRDAAATLLRLLVPVPDQCVLTAGAPMAWAGPLRHYTGLLRLTTGDPAGAAADLRAALAVERRLGARPAEARTRTALAEALLATGDRRGALDAAHRARELATELGMRWLVAEQVPLLEGLGVVADAEPAEPSSPVTRAVLRRVGDTWQVGVEGREAALRDSKGVRYLARLLATPDVEHEAVALGGGAGGSDAEKARVNVTRALRTAIAAISRTAPELADHLTSAVQTGRGCAYRPDPTSGITWTVRA